MAFRQAFGLRADRDYVESSLSAPDFVSAPYGVPLSQDEFADMQARLQVQNTIGDAVSFAIKQPGYAGVYLDQQDHGRPIFLFTTLDASRDQAIETRLPKNVSFTVRQVDYSLERLDGTKTAILKDMPLLRAQGYMIVDVGPDIVANTVEVGVDGDASKARERLASYGPEVVVTEAETPQMDACTGVNNCAPAKAGLHLTAADGGGCTEGPFVRKSTGKKLMITAGHCFGLHDLNGVNWKHNGSLAAVSGQNTWSLHDHNPPDPDCDPNLAHPIGCDMADTDVGLFQEIDPNSDFLPALYNKFAFNNAGSFKVGLFNSWFNSDHQLTNTTVCRTGYNSFLNPQFPLHCGLIVRTDHWEWSCLGPGTTPPCAAIDHEWKVNIDTTAGDSGGPYYAPPCSPQDCGNSDWTATFYGIVTHSVKDETCWANSSKCAAWYTPTTWIDNGLASEINVNIDRFCIGATCDEPIFCYSWGCGT